MDVLGLIGTFIRVVENGSIAAAARAKGMSPAAVSQSLSRLEGHLGVRLLSRTTRSMTLTENGKRYFEKVRHIPDDVELASQAAAHVTKPKGPLCIATTAAFGRYVLAPLMPAFKASFPDIDIELISTDRNVSHHLEGVDVSIRIEAQLNDQLIARKIASLPFIFCAAPAYLDRAGTPQTPEDLSQHDCVVFRYPTDRRFLPWSFMVNGQLVNAKLNPSFISDDIDIIAKIAVNGGGIARLASFVAQPLIDAGQLRPVYWSGHSESNIESLPMDIFACVTERSALNSKVRAFIEFLEEAM
ncbi:LysR family transcriptional regulator [Leclercia adecarboxylata]|uniref:LysR family transcriptional regulator n=3 Tax=Leclercia adecarboxylata TaxID=83655 RepID=A0A9X3YE15_9ENTR|nr:LysR family transcriptional regulator [Leclercia adecarboxylata]MBD1404307.1 LysR family transcriptional regulator [Leclercia adecarboxylata]MDC6624844.1 LysR family transcriptional regulator [Leclercia adecarboxylata]MDC6635795.1 LysR family transcriptional regulator [Leclercia adecarboxylata]MDC6640917.1 LysR family transcriptional regulator [Leclercia adecarboxylata]MDC6651840.1 LysR family transcriptional regulator [Leclercia adecarboxylata]